MRRLKLAATPRRLDERADLRQAVLQGYLELRGSRARRRRMLFAWLAETRHWGRPFLTVERHDRALKTWRVHLELHPRQTLSGLDWEGAQGLCPGGTWHREGHVLDLSGIPRRVALAVARGLARRFAGVNHETPAARYLEGLALCVDPTVREAELTIGELVAVRQLPNDPTRCVVYRHRRQPLVGLPRDAFRLVERAELLPALDRLV